MTGFARMVWGRVNVRSASRVRVRDRVCTPVPLAVRSRLQLRALGQADLQQRDHRIHHRRDLVAVQPDPQRGQRDPAPGPALIRPRAASKQRIRTLISCAHV